MKQENRVKCEVWSRVVGYLRPTSMWNEGKQAEFSDRIMFKGFPEIKNVTDQKEAEYWMWVGIIERYPEEFLGEVNDCALIPERILKRLKEKFDFYDDKVERGCDEV